MLSKENENMKVEEKGREVAITTEKWRKGEQVADGKRRIA